MAAPTESRIPNLHRAMNAHIRVRMEGWRQKYTRQTKTRERRTPMSSFVRRTLLWLASRAVKAQDDLAALALDRPTSQPNKIHIRTKGKHGYELAQPQNALTSAGLLMEGQCTDPIRLGT